MGLAGAARMLLPYLFQNEIRNPLHRLAEALYVGDDVAGGHVGRVAVVGQTLEGLLGNILGWVSAKVSLRCNDTSQLMHRGTATAVCEPCRSPGKNSCVIVAP